VTVGSGASSLLSGSSLRGVLPWARLAVPSELCSQPGERMEISTRKEWALGGICGTAVTYVSWRRESWVTEGKKTLWGSVPFSDFTKSCDEPRLGL
jgi:hypothetical protein